MDPTACYRRWAAAVAAQDTEEADAAYDDLAAWLLGGGFWPEVSAAETHAFCTYRLPAMALR